MKNGDEESTETEKRNPNRRQRVGCFHLRRQGTCKPRLDAHCGKAGLKMHRGWPLNAPWPLFRAVHASTEGPDFPTLLSHTATGTSVLGCPLVMVTGPLNCISEVCQRRLSLCVTRHERLTSDSNVGSS